MDYDEAQWLAYTRDFFTHTPVFQFMGAEIAALATGRSVVKMKVRPEFGNTWNNMHGGCMAVLADFAMGLALRTLRYNIVTVELGMNFIAPAVVGEELTAEGKLVHQGKKIFLAEATISERGERLVAKAKATFMALGRADMNNKWRGGSAAILSSGD